MVLDLRKSTSESFNWRLGLEYDTKSSAPSATGSLSSTSQIKKMFSDTYTGASLWFNKQFKVSRYSISLTSKFMQDSSFSVLMYWPLWYRSNCWVKLPNDSDGLYYIANYQTNFFRSALKVEAQLQQSIPLANNIAESPSHHGSSSWVSSKKPPVFQISGIYSPVDYPGVSLLGRLNSQGWAEGAALFKPHPFVAIVHSTRIHLKKSDQSEIPASNVEMGLGVMLDF